jgi:hypothetical protein
MDEINPFAWFLVGFIYTPFPNPGDSYEKPLLLPFVI